MDQRFKLGRYAAIAVVLAAGIGITAGGANAARQGDRAFTIANYPVDATAVNAVAARQQALADGRQAAFRSLLKRLVPATSYSQIDRLKKLDAAGFIDGLRVRAEENSRTQYVATLDYTFRPDLVRNLLRDNGVPFVDTLAPVTKLLVVYGAPRPGTAGMTAEMAEQRGGQLWRNVWQGLDLANSLAPLEMVGRSPRFAPDALKRLLAADGQAIASLAAANRTSQLLIAYAEPDPPARRLNVTIAGQDAIGRFSLPRKYRMTDDDFGYSLELAAVIAQGVLEGRWKARMAPTPVAGATTLALQSVQVVCEFNNLAQWQRQQHAIAETPGVRDLQIGGLAGRSATIALRFPGGGAALQTALRSRGISLENINGFWILR